MKPSEIELVLVRRATEGDRDALETIVRAIQDDVYQLVLRMLGSTTEAQDVAQEILIKLITNLGSFRGDSNFRTWVWTIATRHTLASRRAQREQPLEFEALEAMIDSGDARATPDQADEEVLRLAEEVRLNCTQAMLLALDPQQRIVYVLSDLFGLTSVQAAEVLALEPPVIRKRLERARTRLGDFMRRKCGILNPVAACRCVRQIPVLIDRGMLDRRHLLMVDHPARPKFTEAWNELREIDSIARIHCDRPDYAAPEALLAQIRELLDAGRFQIFNTN